MDHSTTVSRAGSAPITPFICFETSGRLFTLSEGACKSDFCRYAYT